MRPRLISLLCAFLVLVPLGAALGSESPILLDFNADRCGPCKAIQPTIERLAQDGFDVRPVNVDQRSDLAKRYNVSRIPCLVIVQEDGTELDRVVGVTTYDELRGKMLKHSGRRGKPAARSPLGKHRWFYVPKPAGHRTAVLRIFVRGQGEMGLGTGTLISVGDQRLVLTARHVVRGVKQAEVQDCYGNKCQALVLGTDPMWDCALLQPVGQLSATSVEVAHGDDAVMEAGREYETCGFGPPNTQLACSAPNEFMQYAGPPQSKTSDWMVLSGQSRPGDSGGPVFNAKGQLLGIIWGGQPGVAQIMCVQPGRVHAFLLGYWQLRQQQAADYDWHASPNAPRDPSSILVAQHQASCPSGRCANGVCPTSGGYGRDVVVGVGVSTPPQGRLPWRKGVDSKLDTIDGKIDAIPIVPPPAAGQTPPAVQQPPDMVPVIRSQIDQAVPPMIKAATDPLAEQLGQVAKAVEPIAKLKERLDAAEAAGGLRGRVAQRIEDKVFGDASDRPETKKGFFSRIFSIADDPQHLWVLIAVAALFVLWKKGGIHHIVESKREKLEADAESGGLKGRVASRLLALHDGPVGDRLDQFEDRVNAMHAKVDDAKSKSAAALNLATKVASAAPAQGSPSVENVDLTTAK